MTYREINQAGLEEICSYEQFRAYAYDDKQPNRTVWANVSQVKGKPTIGFGHTLNVTAQDIINRRSVTKDQAFTFMRADLQVAYKEIYDAVGENIVNCLSDGQYAGLVSFVFNCGLDPKWTITKLLKAKRFDDVPDQMARFVNSGGVRCQGLVNRRRADIDLWHSGVTVSTAVGPAEAAPLVSVKRSRTVRAAMLSGFTGLLTATTAAISQLQPFATMSELKPLMLTLVCVSSLAAFGAAAFRSMDGAGAGA